MSNLSLRTVCEVEAGRGNTGSFDSISKALDIVWVGIPRDRTLISAFEILRERRNWTKDRTCAESGVSRPALDRLEAGGPVHMSTLQSVLGVLAPTIRPRQPERAEWAGGDRDCRYTPPEIYAPIIDVFGEIDLDPCSDEFSRISAKAIITKEKDGLSIGWQGSVVFVNPPFSGSAAWIRKCNAEWRESSCRTIVGLFPARTHTVSFHRQVIGVADVLLLERRIRFLDTGGETRNPAPFGCMIVVWGAQADQMRALQSRLPGALIPRSPL